LTVAILGAPPSGGEWMGKGFATKHAGETPVVARL
jgi:hypothetical protein